MRSERLQTLAVETGLAGASIIAVRFALGGRFTALALLALVRQAAIVSPGRRGLGLGSVGVVGRGHMARAGTDLRADRKSLARQCQKTHDERQNPQRMRLRP
jgi:hypothetical protein